MVLPVNAPPVRVKPSTPVWLVGDPPVAAISDTSPAGVPVPLLAATVIDTLTAVPWAAGTGVVFPPAVPLSIRVVVVPRNVARAHWVTRFSTFNEPKPVAKS